MRLKRVREKTGVRKTKREKDFLLLCCVICNHSHKNVFNKKEIANYVLEHFLNLPTTVVCEKKIILSTVYIQIYAILSPSSASVRCMKVDIINSFFN